MSVNEDLIHGRGAQKKPHNKFSKQELVKEHIEGIDEEEQINQKTQLYYENPKKLINVIESEDLRGEYSMNPYQGCEHGCVYCYARNSHQYWGFNSGIDFESKIIIKQNAPELLEKTLRKSGWNPKPIMLSGNTDCYQPVERKFQITRRLLEVLLKYKHPVSIITKNSLVTRDIDLLSEMAKLNLVHVNVSVTSLDEDLRLKLEPRTASAKKRLKTIEELSKNNIPVRIMAAPMIPALNSHELPEILKAGAEHGALAASYIVVRLNGQIGDIFEDWIRKAYPDKADKVLNQIKACHGGQLNDSRYGLRMRGEGNEADAIALLFKMAHKKHFSHKQIPPIKTDLFEVPPQTGDQLSIF
jgi:DNA repair photolyase